MCQWLSVQSTLAAAVCSTCAWCGGLGQWLSKNKCDLNPKTVACACVSTYRLAWLVWTAILTLTATEYGLSMHRSRTALHGAGAKACMPVTPSTATAVTPPSANMATGPVTHVSAAEEGHASTVVHVNTPATDTKVAEVGVVPSAPVGGVDAGGNPWHAAMDAMNVAIRPGPVPSAPVAPEYAEVTGPERV